MSDIDFKAASHDGAGVDWPHRLRRPRALLRPRRGLRRRRRRWPRASPSCPTATSSRRWGSPAPRPALRTRMKAKFGHTLTQGRTANLTRPDPRPAACHYCGPCEHGCVTHSYFNAVVHDDGRCDGDGPVHARHRRDGVQGAGRSRHASGARRALHRSRRRGSRGDLRPRRRALRADAGVGADPVQLGDASGSRPASRTRAACSAST